MLNRRKFLATAGLAVASAETLYAAIRPDSTAPAAGKPIVLSTWDSGVKPNQGAWEVLKSGGRALDAVEQGVKVAEADPENFTVGFGGLPDRDGIVTLDACIMDDQGNCGSVAALETIMHPISVARQVMEKTPHIMLAGDGALRFALQHGFKQVNLLTPSSEAKWKEWKKTAKYEPQINIENKTFRPDKLPGNQYNHDTIGMLALDVHGNLSGACSTSGMAYKVHGRVGDSPIIGAGLYVDNEVGAATATGVGEEVIRNAGSFLVVELMRQGYSPQDACKEAVNRLIRKKPERTKNLQVGFLALNKEGVYGAYSIQNGFTFAICDKANQSLIVQAKSHF